jgi:uncharacterized SAM-binding protein YcdF (DUF218 family)
MRISLRLQIFIVFLTLAALWMGGLFWFVRDLSTMTPPQNPRPADAIVVLTGGSNRLETGFDLLQKDLGKKLFISGVYRGLEVRALMKLFKQESSAKLECCVALGNAENTIGNAAETAEWLARENCRNFYLVTANYHMHRALLEMEATAPGRKAIPWPVSPDKLDMKTWWRDGTSRWLVIREYSKYLLALVRYAVVK